MNQFLNALDQEPWFTLSAWADWCEENNELLKVEPIKWLIKHKRDPQLTGVKYRWFLQKVTKLDGTLRKRISLSRGIHVLPCNGKSCWITFRKRSLAYVAAVDHLISNPMLLQIP